MATEKLVAGSGVGLTWSDLFTGTNLNSLASGNALAGNDIDNSSALDMFMDVSISLASAVFAAPNYVGLFMYALNKDGSTFGDGRFGSSAAGPPPTAYWVRNIPLVAATQAQNGIALGIAIPPGHFKIVLYNNGGVAWAASGNTCQYRTYNRQVA